ncbi:transcription elongation factor SPT6 [Anopheles merus]|uniref:Transcription elongation factor SPT6 n=1 Tax=Anopheles merus TaxID=30066 RepID=A0A182URQ2_ANOME|nr:transcription elongation factor SPT6 [Anopheles merus]
MADFIDSEAEESEDEEELEPHERKRLKKNKAVSDSEDEEEDDEDRLREELKDLIDDNPIEEESDNDDSDDGSEGGHQKRKKSDDELDDRLEDEDYELIEENLGVKVERKRFKRLKKFTNDDGSDGESGDEGMIRETIENRLFDAASEEDEERASDHDGGQRDTMANVREHYDEEEDEESDADDFIVDDDGVPISDKRKKRRHIFTDASLQEGQDIFGVDFDYDEFEKYDDEYEEGSEAEDEYEEEQLDQADRPSGERGKKSKPAARKRMLKKSIYEIYEPSELKRGHFTDLDNEIRKIDIPERMQLRDIPVTAVPEGSNELEEEAEWIYQQAFCKPHVSDQGAMTRKPPSNVPKIKHALDFMRNQHLEVPFIAFYRKEYVQPDLNINDLWKIYKFDSMWCQLLGRKTSLQRLYESMRNYQLDKLMENPDAPIPEDMRVIRDEDLSRLRSVQSHEELKDVHLHFLLYYAHDIAPMRLRSREKSGQQQQQPSQRVQKKARTPKKKNPEDGEGATEDGAEGEENGDGDKEEDAEEEDEEEEKQEEETVGGSGGGKAVDDAGKERVRLNIDVGPYEICRKRGLTGLTKRFGLTPEQFAENVRDSYQRHEVEQETKEPLEVAKEYMGTTFESPEEVLQGGVFMVARQLAREPLFRKCIRELYFERAKLNVRPTKKGMKEIDETHHCYAMKYLKEKPVRDLTGDQYLKLYIAQEDKLLTMEFVDRIEGNTSGDFLEELKALYHRDEFAKNVQEWNKVRAECVVLAVNRMVIPDLKRELHNTLLTEAKDAVLRVCCRKLYNWIKVAPYKPPVPDFDDYEWETTRGVRVMGVAYVPDYTQSAFGAIIAPDGEVTDYLRIPHLLKKKNAYRESEKQCKESDLRTITNFIRSKKPHVIVIGGESKDALMVQQDFVECVKRLQEEEQFPQIAVEIADNELAKVYANSVKGTTDFKEYPPLLRQAISLARRIQDPLVEFSQLCNSDEEILCLRYHTLQEQLTKEELLENIQLEFINRTNEVGVDVNLAVQNPLTANLVQFICGLGPRKGQTLLKVLKQTNSRLENRTQLVTTCHMGPKVFINCSGFIKIDTNSLGDSTETYVEVLDGSRVHPETYEWARKMAVDALEYDDEEANPAGALEEILEAPERLKDLDLDAFAIELDRQGFGNKSITLYDIRAELNSRYKDLRTPFRSVTAEELFDYLTKETPESLFVGKMMLATVSGFTYRKPQGEQLDQANPVRNDETGFWQCPFCMKTEFPELSEVWNHFDAGECPGQATGVRVRFDNGLNGFIHIKNLSDKHVKNPEERVQIGQTVHVRVTKIDIERFSLECSSKSSDLCDRKQEWRPRKDPCYDQELEEADTRKEADSKKQQARQQYVKRVIVHPSFHNISYAEALKLLEGYDQGDVIVRPSSKGSDHLTATWKVTDGIYQHIDVREEGKENVFSLGQSLWIGNDEFEDLDEIIARHITPMATYVRDLLNYKYYRDTDGGSKEKAEEIIKAEKQKNPNKIHYIVSVSKTYPGRFLLSYLPRNKFRHEYVTVTPDGYRFRHQTFDSVNSLLKWFKEHFRDPIPIDTPKSTPKVGGMSSRTPYGSTPKFSDINSETIESVAKNMPTHMLNSLSAAAHHTPHYSYTPLEYGSSNFVTTPYTPSGQTPYMTPYQQTPHFSQTPRYGTSTPSQYSNKSAYTGIPTGHPPPSASHHGYKSTSAARGMGGVSSAASSSSSLMMMQQPSPYSNSSDHHYRTQQPPMHHHARNNEYDSWSKATDSWSNRGNSSNMMKGYHGASERSSGGSYHHHHHGGGGGVGRSSDSVTSSSSHDHRMTPRSSSKYSATRSPMPPPAQPPPQQTQAQPAQQAAAAASSAASLTLGDATPLWDE